MRRSAGLGVVLALLVAAFVYGSHRGDGGSTAAPQAAPDLAALRTAAALAPCPSGLSPRLPALAMPCVGAPGTVQARATGSGRPMVVNLWATWCGPCVKEVPLLQSLHTRTRAVDVVGVLTEDSPEHALQFAQDPTLGFDMTYASVADDQGVLLRRYAKGPPVTLFVTADGAIAKVQRGALSSQAQLDGLVRQYLGVTL
ncbi:MAG: putative thiol-disulfide oxidoreductase [Frankiales bacterium]|nr:putative thiol-disulfide oxidoreductase [Frankiales bacterium]